MKRVRDRMDLREGWEILVEPVPNRPYWLVRITGKDDWWASLYVENPYSPDTEDGIDAMITRHNKQRSICYGT